MIIDRGFVKDSLPERSEDANKYSVGTLLCVCGSNSMAGAAIMSAKAALRMGAGLVRVAVPESIYPIVSEAVPEAVFLVLPEGKYGTVDARAMRQVVTAANKSDAVLMGCGSKLCADTIRITLALLYHAEVPLILDADGINALSKHIDILNERKYPTVLTPHEGEMSRLLRMKSCDIRADRAGAAKTFADNHNCVLVLKGKDTLIAMKNEELLCNPTGNAAMATAGSGDVLAGMIASLIAQGVSPFEAGAAGVYLHGLCGDLAAKQLLDSVLPTDMTELIPEAVKDVMA